MFKAVIFDLNGVFIKSRKLSERFEEKFGVKQEEFLPALNAIMPKVRMPDAGDAFSYWKPYFDKWGLDLSKEAFFDFWFSGEKEAPEMISLARELKDRGVKLFILSNNVIERTKFYNNNFPFLKELFEKVYYSWQTGFTKSNAGAYQKLLEENNLKPEECVFFDDSPGNVAVANGLGIKSYLFESAEKTREILNPPKN
ncbi:MAG: HAD-superfamily hydrolase, subfamily IA, variant 3 [Candidatus Jorgensenbacteria bacterium GW2011_GWA1_48_13]|uniref:HAD-superfamily hydrolase, subfamily IA, variant 3 n=2 Tax=Candidatus Joergenseniibacteriota TaxID=1752739 RepID=A0A0G1W8V1_9BACT|nr:MAG: HAD-superfamily hydrolase, subfamily IA, variant 3 [Candidatus Jorgensenbacteria bacterium GW2011_GWA1_48_13]KKU98918.1 MAG: HAD-superfamily hydrolase, subfamily IA, variant 3 [Candidatus Jorgensenbacteria bacterium GW2011_GWC1_48_8]KKW15148.1 MAG: HAD-superfamily hydrolase, subfamily IA, variant 3 [Candidatus Jorgensenbacteria bacterium GW2011_GWB1_50_10]